MAGHDHGQYTAGGAHPHHILPQRTIFLVFGALLGLMVLTIVAAFAPGPHHASTFLMNVIALAIAVTKATLVVAYFMGVKSATRLVKIFAIGGFVWFFTLFIMMADYATRPLEPVPGWEVVPSSALPRDASRPE